jgi:cytochrome c-type biogenesis protein CcmH
MHAVFWIMTLFMTVVALSFVLTPLARARLRGTSALLVAAIPAFVALTYFVIGSPNVTSATEHTDTTRSAERHAATNVGSVASLTAGLEARLEEQPDDGEGWLLLAKSYFYLGRLEEARQAYARAVALGNADATVAQQVGADIPTTGGVAGSVSLSAAAAELVEPDDTVFIFARPPGQAGAPVAVVRKAAETWPLAFRLTDAQSMTDGVRLSDLEQVVVTARISRRGDADSALRTLEAKSQPIDIASNAPVHLTIE